MPKKPEPATNTPRWDVMRAIIRQVIESKGPLAQTCKDQGWDYQPVWACFFSQTERAPKAERVLEMIAYALENGKKSDRQTIFAALGCNSVKP